MSLIGDKRMRKVWTFTIEKEVLEKFKDECWKKRLKMSTVVNELIKKWLEEHQE